VSSPDPRQVAAARERFTALVEGPEEAIDIAEAALWIAAEHQPDLEPAATLAALSDLAKRTGAGLDPELAWPDRVAAIARHLFHREGLRGNEDEYYDPRNSFLDQVLERGSGIPITLSLVFVEVCRRLGLAADGVGFPGHFLAKVSEGDAQVVVDPFHGATLSRDDIEARLREVMGPEARLEPEHLRSARPREILARMLGNLKQIYAGRGELESAVACCDRLLLLAPDAAFEVRDRGVLYHQLEFHHPAVTDLSRFLEMAPEHESAEVVRRMLVESRARAGALH